MARVLYKTGARDPGGHLGVLPARDSFSRPLFAWIIARRDRQLIGKCVMA